MIKQKIYHIVEKGSHGTRLNLVFDYFIMTLILLNVLAIILESVPEIHRAMGDFNLTFKIFSKSDGSHICTFGYLKKLQ